MTKQEFKNELKRLIKQNLELDVQAVQPEGYGTGAGLKVSLIWDDAEERTEFDSVFVEAFELNLMLYKDDEDEA